MCLNQFNFQFYMFQCQNVHLMPTTKDRQSSAFLENEKMLPAATSSASYIIVHGYIQTTYTLGHDLCCTVNFICKCFRYNNTHTLHIECWQQKTDKVVPFLKIKRCCQLLPLQQWQLSTFNIQLGHDQCCIVNFNDK